MTEDGRRPFASGSKPGPDAVDHFLEIEGLYRKHIARDSSSLFRVVSEHVFGIQNFHEKVRNDCADFMDQHHQDYANEVDKNFYNYVGNLRKLRTHGTLLELKAIARKYRRNVVLFEPTQNLQTTSSAYVQNEAYDVNPPIRIFYSHKDKHFDIIFTMDHVEKLAECQAIVYDILYSRVFRLPDVQYAVERMLHDQEEQVTVPLDDDPTKYKKQSGEIVAFDSHSDTDCVLKDPKTCHFHNQVNFEEIVNENKDAITVINRADEPGRLKIFKPIDGFLHDNSKSCVRQLLDEKITPFPYKVAKALDPSIYRNTEFELWNENRKELRMKWLGPQELSAKSGVDDKWIFYDRRNGLHNVRKFYDGKLEQAVVDESEYMALDDDMKKKYVVLDPSSEPFKLQYLTGLSNFMPSKESLDLTVMPANVNYNRDGSGRGNYKTKRGNRYNSYGNNRFNDFPNRQYGNNQQQQITSGSDSEARDHNDKSAHYRHQDNDNQNAPLPVQMNPMPVHLPTPGWAYAQPGQFAALPPAQFAISSYQPPLNYQQVMPYGNFSIPPPLSIAAMEAAPVQENLLQGQSEGSDLMNIIRESELTSTTINWNPKESVDANGADLPTEDTPTLRFYFNLGVRYFLASGIQRRLESVVNQMEKLDTNDSSEKSTSEPVEPPPVPTNTPVTTKLNVNSGPPGTQHQHGLSFRRQFKNSREGGPIGGNQRIGNWNNNNSKKDFKFNSNVKNVHKAETLSENSKSAGSQQQQGNQQTQEKTSPPLAVPVTNFSPILPLPQDVVTNAQFQAQQQQTPQTQDSHQTPMQHQQQFVPQAQYWQRPISFQDEPQPGVGIVYQMYNEDGTISSQYAVPQYQYQHYQPQLVPQFQAQQQYGQQFLPPHTPVLYTPIQQQVMDGSLSNNDSGVAETAMYYQQSFQPPAAVQYYATSAPTVPTVFYAPSPIPQTPQIAQVGPVFPTQPQQTRSEVQEVAPTITRNTSQESTKGGS